MTHTGQLLDLFLRCRFSELIETCDGLPSDNFAATLYKSNALYEQHRIDEAKELLTSVSSQRQIEFDEDFFYVQARQHYFEDELDQAQRKFVRIIESTTSTEHRFKGMLGVANVFYSQGRFEKIPPIVEELEKFDSLGMEHSIALEIFKGNFFLAGKKDYDLARNHFKQALKLSARRAWTYYVGRSLYGLACVAQNENNYERMETTIDILLSYVEESESLFLQYLINERFKADNYHVNQEVQFDSENKRILINGEWVELHASPLIFDFLHFLREKDEFTTKIDLAHHLWEGEDYNPEVHDPRIFDLAKRIRKRIERYENKPLILLSGSMGYKLSGVQNA